MAEVLPLEPLVVLGWDLSAGLTTSSPSVAALPAETLTTKRKGASSIAGGTENLVLDLHPLNYSSWCWWHLHLHQHPPTPAVGGVVHKTRSSFQKQSVTM